MEFRVERDSLGEVKVPREAYWGAVTQRSMENLHISGTPMPRLFIKALGIVKLACARANHELGIISSEPFKAIEQACKEVIAGELDDHFPVDVFQTGSGTHSNMNSNEVIANRAAELLGFDRGSHHVHPNDHVNASQSSNDVIPTSMHISAVESLKEDLIPILKTFEKELGSKARELEGIVKTGRTHLMDATPTTLGLEFRTYQAQIKKGIERIENALPFLLELPIGGTAVGTGINAPDGFAELVVKKISLITGQDFRENPIKSEGIAAHDAFIELSGALKTLAVSLTKISEDVRWMVSGPGAGLAEITIPANEPGSSIMPGKVNPTQAEALLMACTQVIGLDAAVTIAGSRGNFELNVMKPLIIWNILESIKLMSNSVSSFTKRCLFGIKANEEHIQKIVERNLMLVTALSPIIGYEKAAEIAKEAAQKGASIREVAIKKGVLSESELDRLLDPSKML